MKLINAQKTISRFIIYSNLIKAEDKGFQKFGDIVVYQLRFYEAERHKPVTDILMQIREIRMMSSISLLRKFAIFFLAGLMILAFGMNEAYSFETGASVNLASGASTYRIPIQVPPGTNGMQPNLALIYNSDIGNGWIGEGRVLDGLGFVERLGPNWRLTPTYLSGSNDTFRLNFRGASHKLIWDQQGGYYRTETETFLRIYLLTNTSESHDYLLGVVMKSEPFDLGGVPIHRPGTLIGKALEPLKEGEGEILVLLSLQ